MTRQKGTERPFSCARVNDNHQKGTYTCLCCKVPLFTSEAKFEAGCGWPSFSDTLKNKSGDEVDNVAEETDNRSVQNLTGSGILFRILRG